MLPKKPHKRFWLPLILMLLMLINWLASQWHTRIDLTNEKRFTLGTATKKLLRNIDEPVTAEIFLKGNFPSGFRQLSSSAEDLLREFKEVAGNKFRYKFLNPDETIPGMEITYIDSLSAMGLSPINLTSRLKEGQQQQLVYPYALLHYKNKTLPVALFQTESKGTAFEILNNEEALMEFRVADGISRIMQTEKTVVGYLTGNGEPQDYRSFDLAQNFLKEEYQLFVFDINTPGPIPDAFKALIVVKPNAGFSEESKLKLDQYVMNGGKLIMFIDRLNAEMDSLQIKNQVIAVDRELKLNDLLFQYGVRINADLVMDLQCDYLPFDVNGNGQFELLPWNYFPLIGSPNNHPINKGLGLVSGKFVNSIDTVEAEGIKKTVILNSSANARTIGSPALISPAENVNAPEDEKYKKAAIPVAVLLEGKFTSLYANRVSAPMRDSLESYNTPFLAKCTAGNKMIIVADGDIVLNSLAKGSPTPMGANPYTYGTQREYPFANKKFIKNCLEYLTDPNALNEAASKGHTLRLLDPKKTESQKTFWQGINILLPVIFVLLFAMVFRWIRKRKYTIE